MPAIKQKQAAQSQNYVVENKQNNSVQPEGQLIAFKSSNDLLYEELEMRYGGGFAQWIIDGLNKKQ